MWRYAGSLLAVVFVVGCGPSSDRGQSQHEILEEDLIAGVEEEDPDGSTVEEDDGLTKQERRGKRLFNQAHFNGNGRRCQTCHPSGDGESGTLSPADVQELFARKPNDPLFRWDGADSLGGDTFERLLEHATILVEIPLPENVSIVGSDARSVIVPRGIPTTMNTPALDDVLMHDGRAPNLQEQALGAITGHAQTTNVTDGQLDAIAAFELTLFNREPLRQWANGGPPPTLPEGNTESEKRGRAFFVPADTQRALCGHCHSGPNLDETSTFGILTPPRGSLPGTRFTSVLVSEFNDLGLPTYTFEFVDPVLGIATRVTSPDPGRALITGDPADANKFKINTVWGAKETAPYFHDNSAKTLEELVDHYDRAFNEQSNGMVDLTEQDKIDIVAFMELL